MGTSLSLPAAFCSRSHLFEGMCSEKLLKMVLENPLSCSRFTKEGGLTLFVLIRKIYSKQRFSRNRHGALIDVEVWMVMRIRNVFSLRTGEKIGAWLLLYVTGKRLAAQNRTAFFSGTNVFDILTRFQDKRCFFSGIGKRRVAFDIV